MADQITVAQAASLAGVRPSTWRSYVARGQAPPPDGVLGGTPWWRRATVVTWVAARPRAGTVHLVLDEKGAPPTS